MKGRDRKYHHGNLREALIDASRDLIAEKSPQGFLLSDAAKVAGVSPAAPYRHFKGKDELIAAVAIEGFFRFGDVLMEAYNDAKTAKDGLQKMLSAYLQYATNHKGEYMAMFESGININQSPELSHASSYAFRPLHLAADDLVETLPKDNRPPTLMIAQHIWSMSHGVAELFGRGEGNVSPFSAQELLESQALIYLKGLGIH